VFVSITNTPRDYAWGSRSAIAEVLGREPSGGHEAELWLGAHPAAPSRIKDPTEADGHETLDAFIAADPERALGRDRTGDSLPFLLKLLAADEPLSIQAHPSPEQAREGFARENAAGIAIDAFQRNYKDDRHKPELVFALSDTFDALAGFRDVSSTLLLVEALGAVATAAGHGGDGQLLGALAERLRAPGEPGLRNALDFALSGTEDARTTTAAVVRAARRVPAGSAFARECETLVDIDARHPWDPGILVALLMNRVALPQGEALYLPSGNIHAYLKGLAVEIMAASDNVLRGGLTDKHIDTQELQKVVRFESVPAPFLLPEPDGAAVEVFRPDVPDFLLVRVDLGAAEKRQGDDPTAPSSASVVLPGPGILLALDGGGPEDGRRMATADPPSTGGVTVTGRRSSTTIPFGGAAFVTPDEEELDVSGTGTLFLATVNR
jgi:mannose-6-phosphate isomerase